MAEQEQVERLRYSVDEWNQWRREQPDLHPDLRGANLKGTDLGKADLSRANLREADCREANLREADCREANLDKANLDKANLKGTNLSSSSFRKTRLNGSILCWADLRRVDLSGAKLSGADLSGADLGESILSGANLSGADLNGAILSGAVLSGTVLTAADVSNAHLLNTTFAQTDLNNVKGLEKVIHHGPSTVNINSVILPMDENVRKQFLRGVGFSDIFIDYLPSLLTTPIQYHSLFLSYSHYDHLFAKRLHSDLQNRGVRCWFAPHDLRPGTPIVRGIEEAIHLHEKLLLILSTNAVTSNWVKQEVELALYKEVTSGQEILFPIRLDNTILESDTLWAKRLRQRHVGDFTCWEDDTVYHEAFTTLLRHLKVARPPTS